MYPEVVAAGGLAAALKRAAQEACIDLGDAVTPHKSNPYAAASVASGRADIYVALADDERFFEIDISNDRQIWTRGSTTDLAEVVQAVDCWRRGMKLRELTTRFPLLEHTRIAQAYEDGNDLEVRWDMVLENPDFWEIRPFMEAAREHQELAAMYPYVSHLTRVFFQKDLDKSA